MMIIQDLHAHTRYSSCGRDEPKVVVQAALDSGIQVLGITDHNYGIGDRKRAYYQEIKALRKDYGDQIHILCGIEIATMYNHFLLPGEDISYFDYCLVEHLDNEASCIGQNIISFAKCVGIRTGIAHTDLFGWIDRIGQRPEDFLHRLAENEVFWELNVNYDSVHHYREHDYVKTFCESHEQQELIRQSGLQVSVGFDGHRVEDYQPTRVINMCKFLYESRINMPFISDCY